MIRNDVVITEKKYGDKVILKDQTFSFDLGSITCFTGKSGCGKTTLLKILNHEITDFKGSLSLQKKDVGYVGQDSFFIEKFTAFDNIIVGLKNPNINEINRCAKLLNVYECLNEKCQNLSGGQRQRISILRCITRENKYILLDEPTSNLDAENINYLLNLLREIAQENHIAFIIATHEAFVVDFCDIVYKYDTLGFKLVKNNEFKKQTEKPVNNELYSLKKLLPKYYFTYILKHLVFLFAYFLIIVLFIWGLGSMRGLLQTDYDRYYDSLPDDLIFIQKKSQETICDSNYMCQNNYYFEDLTFTEEEINAIENDIYAEEVYLAENLEITKFDNEGNELSNLMIDNAFFDEPQLDYLIDIRQKILSSSQDYKQVTMDNTVNYHFTSINVPIEYIESLGYYTEVYPLTNIMYGTNNLIDNNDIVIPYSLALYISSITNIEPQNLINQEIKLPVINSNGQLSDKKYEIVGIYDETNCVTNQSLGNIYVKNESNLTVEGALLENNNKYGNNEKYMQVYPNDEEFYTVNDTGVTTIIIKSSNIEEIEKQFINSDDIVVSKNLYKDENFKSEKLLSVIFSTIMLFLLLLFLVLIKRIIRSLYLKNVINDMTVWKIVQYENNEIDKFYKNIDFFNFALSLILIFIFIFIRYFW